MCKVNIDSDGRLAMTAMIRKTLGDNPKEFDPRKYLGPARDELKLLIIEKNKNVLGSAGKGKEIFNSTCAHCHGPNGVVEDRKINLRRLHLKYGEQLEETYFTTVTNGRPTKGMPAWKDVFSHQDFADILGYLRTIEEK